MGYIQQECEVAVRLDWFLMMREESSKEVL